MSTDVRIFITKLKGQDVVHTISHVGMNLSMNVNAFLDALEQLIKVKMALGIAFDRAYEDACKETLDALRREAVKTATEQR